MNKSILVTGGTGYIGSWVSKMLLEKGYTVRLTVRDKSKENKYAHLVEIANKTDGKLELWEADLLKEGSFDEAAQGCDAVIHMASPFTLRFKNAQKELIDPALKGTRNVLNAASKSTTVKKIVLTSSIAAINGDNADLEELKIPELTEEYFNTTSSVSHQPYSYSKVLAEKEAWKLNKAQNQWDLVVINPTFVMGPSLTKTSNSESLSFMGNLLKGKFATGVPKLMIGYVDVRDVAKAHILALEKDDVLGRHIISERTISLLKFTNIVKDIYGDKYKLPSSESPKFLLYFMGWMFGLKYKFIKRNVGYTLKINNTKSEEQLGLKYTPLENTIKDMVDEMEGVA